jgi:hypothetical protein
MRVWMPPILDWVGLKGPRPVGVWGVWVLELRPVRIQVLRLEVREAIQVIREQHQAKAVVIVVVPVEVLEGPGDLPEAGLEIASSLSINSRNAYYI